MSFDDLKEFNGQPYSGMAVGGSHTWRYTDAIWREQKVAPDRWEFTFKSVKRRGQPAPPGSGVPPDTLYHWYLLAHQRVRKIDEDSYATLMSGLKYKIAHKRPYWRRWSCEYPDQAPERDRVIEVLEEALDRLRAKPAAPAPSPVPSTRWQTTRM